MAEVEDSQLNPFCTIYPLNIDSKKSVSEGRKLPVDVCVPSPTIREIGEVLQKMRVRFEYENDKRHPADPFNYGRVRVLLKQPNGSVVNPELPDKKAVMLALVERIPEFRAEEDKKLLQQQQQTAKNQPQKKKK